jgi:hypothetical protein
MVLSLYSSVVPTRLCLCVCLCGPKGPSCQTNINECASNPCLNQGTCIDDVAGYKCICVLPYTGREILGQVLDVLVMSAWPGGGGHFPGLWLVLCLRAERKSVRW